jgi:tetrahydromethanopterin S-methyltransferase subunit G
MIYITGDTHIPIDIGKLATKRFPEQHNMTKDDFLIITGDFGGVWNNSNEELYWRNWLNEKNFTTLFIDGNHENFNMLNQYPIETFHGGKVHHIMHSIYHLMRGQIFEFNGYTFFTMGGASSHDKECRVENKSWWSDELPNDNEYNEAENNLDRVNRKVDYIITHCAPDSIQRIIADWYGHDKLTNFLESVSWSVDYKKWFFGHYHIDKDIDEKHSVLYDRIIKL